MRDRDLRDLALGLHPQASQESFTKKIRRLQMWHKDTLTGPKPQIHPKNSLSLSIQKAKAEEISQRAHTLSKYPSPHLIYFLLLLFE